jgi:hypothetical protein
MARRVCRTTVSAWLAALFFVPIARAWGAEAPAPEPRTPPQVQAVYVDAPPVIDGKLDDECWSAAARLEGFFVPDQAQPIPEKTVGLICADEKAIYVGVICEDRTPEDIRGVETRRNGSVWRDDYVAVELDPPHGHQVAYDFCVTARGTQLEVVPGGSAAKIEWRGDWKGAAARTPEGWTAEMEIPFSILRYPRGQSTFGLALARHLAEEQLSVIYPDMGKVWDPSLTADLVDLHPPDIAPRPIYMPFTVLDLGASAADTFDSGMDVQYKLPNGLTALGTYRPDYTQIEQVVEPISFSYTERELPEVRPFFVTGYEGFFPGSYAFYSRRIQDFDSGVKLFGEVGNEKIGVLDALSYGDENSFVCSWQHNYTTDFNTVLHTVQHQQAGQPSNSVYQFEIGNTWRRPQGSDMLWGNVLRSLGADADGAVYGFYGVHDRGLGRLHYEGGVSYSTPDYHPALGYYYEQDTYDASVNFGKQYRYESGGLQFRGWSVGAGYAPFLHQEGVYNTHFSPYYDLGWRNGRSLSFGFDYGLDFNQKTTDVHCGVGWNGRELYRAGGFGIVRGRRAGGAYTDVSLGQGFRPGKDVSLRADLDYVRLAPLPPRPITPTRR